MSDQKIRFGIFPKMLVAMTLIAVIPLGTIWFVDFRENSARLEGQVNQQLARIAEGLQGYVDTWVEMNLRMLKQNASMPAIQSLDASRQNPLLKQITQVYDWNYLAFTVAPDGQNIGRSDGKTPKYYGDRMYVQQVLRGAPRGQQVLIGKTSGKPAFVLSVPILDAESAIKGVLAIAMTISEMSERITNVRLGKTGQAFLVDEAGRVIAHQNEAFTEERKDLSGNPAVIAAGSRKSGTLVYTDESGKQRVAAFRKTAYGWTLVAEQALDEAFAPIREANRSALILLAVTLAVVALIAYLLSRRLSVPIQELTRIADDISHGKLDQEIAHIARNDEIGALARSIERLGTSVKLALQRIARYRKAAATG